MNKPPLLVSQLTEHYWDVYDKVEQVDKVAFSREERHAFKLVLDSTQIRGEAE